MQQMNLINNLNQMNQMNQMNNNMNNLNSNFNNFNQQPIFSNNNIPIEPFGITPKSIFSCIPTSTKYNGRKILSCYI